MTSTIVFSALRNKFHQQLIQTQVLTFSPFAKWNQTRIASNADNGQKHSTRVANRMLELIEDSTQQSIPTTSQKQKGQTLGNLFEEACQQYLQDTFTKLHHLRPGNWQIEKIGSRGGNVIGRFEQYKHLVELNQLARKHPELQNLLGDEIAKAEHHILLRLWLSQRPVVSHH